MIQVKLFDFSGGLNDRFSPFLIKDNQLQSCQNLDFDEIGALVKRKGYAKYNTDALGAPIYGLYGYYKKTGTKYFLCASGTDIYKSVSSVWTSIKTGLTANQKTEFETCGANDLCVIVNGADANMKWDGTTFAALGGTPASPVAKYLKWHRNFLFLAGNSTDPSRLYYSTIGNPEDWPAANFIDVNTNDGDVITGLIPFVESLLIFKERSIYILEGASATTFALKPISKQMGCVAPRSLVMGNNYVYFLGRDGVYRFNQTEIAGTKLELVSESIQTTLETINQGYIQNATAIWWDNKYLLSVPTGSSTTNNTVLVFDPRRNDGDGAWLVWTNINANVWCKFLETTNEYLYSGSPTTGNVYRHDTGYSDAGTAITAYGKTKDFTLKSPDQLKRFSHALFMAQAQGGATTLSLGWDLDMRESEYSSAPVTLEAGGSLWGTFVWGTSTWGSYDFPAFKDKKYIQRSGRSIAYKFLHNQLDRGFKVLGIVFYLKTKKLRVTGG